MLRQGRFAGAIVSEDRDKITGLHIQIHVIHCPDRLFDISLFVQLLIFI